MKKQFERAVNIYIKIFEDKHQVQFEHWVGDEVGGLACFGDAYFFDFTLVKYDIDTNAPKGKILDWFDQSVEHATLESNRASLIRELEDAKLPTFPNYHHWLRGCPRPTAEELNKLRKSVENARKLLEEEIENYKRKRHGHNNQQIV